MKFEKWLSQQDVVIEVDCGCVTAEAFYHWLRVAYESGAMQAESATAATVPDGWKLVPVEPTKDMLRAGQSVVGFWLNTVHCYAAMLAAAPQVSDGWIPVTERLPEVGSTIMVHMDNPQHSATDYAIATYDKYGFSRAKVTHWQPLPNPPDAPKGV
ncbi:DUF551 domain-containing protein [Phytobacter ursingii]|uniref:DUF551 domain-containing protein n=1 Tax=Phytobacter ursingii TaxID=1972431 RepID=UPI0031B75E3B